MCGIAAIARIGNEPLGHEADAVLARLADALTHRGPDDRELFRAGPVGMAFTRLSLVDPDGGKQPLVTDDGSLVLIANGEIYNHRELASRLPANIKLRTGSDCEILLHLYRQRGKDFLDDVRGMYAIVLWDRRAGHLVLARDRFGIKPLYYHRNKRQIAVASEMKALLVDPATPRGFDWERALTSPLLSAAPYMDDTDPVPFFTGVSSVPAATVRRIDLRDGTTDDYRYWSFPGRPATTPTTAEGFVESYRDLFAASVSECATADAELGLFLSGGIDSAAVAALAAGWSSNLHTFTVLSASTYRSEDAEYGHRVAEKLGLPNHQVLFDETRVPTPDEWKRLLWLVESPFCGPEVYYKYQLHRYAKQARPELRGMLLGAASDEFNGGYSVNVSGGGNWSDFERNLGSMARNRALRACPDLAPWWTAGGVPLITDEAVTSFTGSAHIDPYTSYVRGQYAKIQQYNVWHEDRTAAGSGIEARVPFLDHRLVELVLAVPPALREDLLWNKNILRRGMRGTLPDDVVERPKQPFFYGAGQHHTYRMLARMLQQHGGSLLDQATASPEARRYINIDAVREVLAQSVEDPGGTQVEMALRVVNLGLLAGMVADPPASIARTVAGPLPRRLSVTDWESERIEIERRTRLHPEWTTDSVLTLADNVLLLAGLDRDGTWYVAIDGSIDFILDDDAPVHRDLLQKIDGQTSLGALLGRLDLDAETARPVLGELIEQRVVVLKD